jgi:hypothetical protein
VLDELRVAHKMIESIYQLSQLKSELSKATVTAWALRAKAAIEQSQKFLVEDEVSPPEGPTAGE